MDWDNVQAVWQPLSGPPAIAEDRFSGKLRVEAGGKVFEATLGNDRAYAFTNR